MNRILREWGKHVDRKGRTVIGTGEKSGVCNSLYASVSVPHGQLNALQGIGVVHLEDKAMVEVGPSGVPVDRCSLKTGF